MDELRIDYEGNEIKHPASEDDTHVVVSTDREGDLRVQPTNDPLHALVRAQRAGDQGTRMAWIKRSVAVFTRVPTYDPRDSKVAEKDRRGRRREMLVLLLLAILIALAIALL